MFRRSKHMVVYVKPEQYVQAVKFYTDAFGATVEEQEEGITTLKGSNFMLYVEVGEAAGINLPEFVPQTEVDAEAHLLGLGCKLLEVNGSGYSSAGFYVEDPYGLRYHIYTKGKEID